MGMMGFGRSGEGQAPETRARGLPDSQACRLRGSLSMGKSFRRRTEASLPALVRQGRPKVSPVPLCRTPGVSCLPLPSRTSGMLGTLGPSSGRTVVFWAFVQRPHLSLECLRSSCLNEGPLFQPTSPPLPAETDLTGAWPLVEGLPGTQGKPAAFKVVFDPRGLSNADSAGERVRCSQLPAWVLDPSCFPSRL